MIETNHIEELRLRWTALQRLISGADTCGMLVSSNTNLFYLAGRVFNGYIYLPTDGDPFFFVRRPVGLTGDRVAYIRKVEDIPALLQERGVIRPETLLLECDSIPHSDYVRYEKAFQPREIGNGTPLIRQARSIKTDFEIEQIRQSARLHDTVYGLIPSLYRPGMTDVEFSIEIEREMRRHGSLGIFRIFGESMEIFMGSVIAGDNADTPSPYDFAMGGEGTNRSLPVGGNGTLLAEGMSVMVDLGGNFTGYMSDMSRIFSVGTLPDLAYRAHDVAMEILRAIEEMARPGIEAKLLYEKAVELATSAGLADYFMGYQQKAGFVGHGLGIEINEAPVLAPRSRDVLTQNMVFAVEPKFVIPGVGAVGPENTYAVTETGLEKLTQCNEKIVKLV